MLLCTYCYFNCFVRGIEARKYDLLSEVRLEGGSGAMEELTNAVTMTASQHERH